nr:RNA-directed DNA polymerase, eukaryota [Tanacetum cinerariifolium]
MNFMSLNIQSLAQKAKKDWVKELCVRNKVNFMSLQETKMETLEIFNIKRCWGNFNFDYVYSPSDDSSGGILCVWDPRMFHKDNSMIFDYLVMVRGEWITNDKMMLWDYLILVIGNWQGKVIIMGDFNKVRKQEEIYGSVFNIHGADAFNLFILNAGLEEIHLGGYSFTWCKTASKMSKPDRFLIFEGIVSACPNISVITLDQNLSNHRPILMRESKFDFGQTPFRFFHYWFDVEGFDEFVKNTWKDAQVIYFNGMGKFMKKLKFLKGKIREWTKIKRVNSNNHKAKLKEQLAEIDILVDKGEGNSKILNNHSFIFKSLQDIDKLESMELAQIAKIKWGIEGDENTKYYRGTLNKQRSQLAISGVLVDEIWINKQSMIFKVDFEKAYDSVRWDFLIDVLKKFDLGDRWCSWTQGCLASSRGSVLVNGSPTFEFQFYKGLKQGDPLSPLLFLLVMKSLHLSVQRVVDADIVRETESLKYQGMNFVDHIHRKMGNGLDTYFWDDAWKRDIAFKHLYPRIYALESINKIFVASKLGQDSLGLSLRRAPRVGAEQSQFNALQMISEVASVRRVIDEKILPSVSSKIRWVNAVPIKVNIHAWKVKLDCLPTRLNISRHGMNIESIICPICDKEVESSSHIFLACHFVREVFSRIATWWDVPFIEMSTYEEWLLWILNLRLPFNNKHMLEGVCYIIWWCIWSFRNKIIFGLELPKKEFIFDDI